MPRDARLEDWTRSLDHLMHEIFHDRSVSPEKTIGRLESFGQHVSSEIEVMSDALRADLRRFEAEREKARGKGG